MLTLLISLHLKAFLITLTSQIFKTNQVLALNTCGSVSCWSVILLIILLLLYSSNFLLYYYILYYSENNQTSKRAKDTGYLSVPGTASFIAEQHPNWLRYLKILAVCFLVLLEIFVSLTFAHLFVPISYHSTSSKLFRNPTSNYPEMICWSGLTHPGEERSWKGSRRFFNLQIIYTLALNDSLTAVATYYITLLPHLNTNPAH